MEKSLIVWLIVGACVLICFFSLLILYKIHSAENILVPIAMFSFMIGVTASLVASQFDKEERITRRAYLEEKGRERARRERT